MQINQSKPVNKSLVLFTPLGLASFSAFLVIIFFVKKFLLQISSEPNSSSTDSLISKSVESIEKHQLIYNGQFSQVWRGCCSNKEVAIKLFTTSASIKCWNVEKEIYTKHNIKHENILNFVSAECRQEQGNLQHMLVTEYAEYGSLYNYLRMVGNLQFENMMYLMLSIVKGTAFLHRGTSKKPVIAHRDLKSQNILIHSDMRCCIGDFGLAFAFENENNTIYTGSNFQVSFLLHCFLFVTDVIEIQ